MKLAVLISGSGRTLKNFIDLGGDDWPVEVELVVSSSSEAGGLQFAREAGIACVVLERSDYESADEYGEAIFSVCRDAEVDLVAMAGFLKLATIPADFVNRVVNIHPSLIPAFCGRGMYGHRVHQAVLDYGAKVTGVTVHFVDNQYDNGPIIWQQPVPVFDDDTTDTLAARVFETERDAYPRVLAHIAAGQVNVEGRHVSIKVGRRPLRRPGID